MTRKEDYTISDKWWQEHAEKFHVDCLQVEDVVDRAFWAGAEWADRTMLDRVYDWLDFYLATAVVEWDEELTKQSFLDELMRKMKGGVG